MTPEKFVKGIWEVVVQDMINAYDDMYKNTDPKSLKDGTYGKKEILFHQSLSDKDKEVFFAIIKQTLIDSAAGVLAVIDGTTWFSDQNGEFELYYVNEEDKDDKSLISGTLTDYFLELDELNRK